MSLSDTLVSQFIEAPYEALSEVMAPFLTPTAVEELVVIMMHLRNIRGGEGNRDVFRQMMSILYDYDTCLVKDLLPLIPHYGYWKDVFYLSKTLPNLLLPTMDLCAQQLIKDEEAVILGYAPSLLAKYIPKQHKEYKHFACSFARYLYPDIECHSLRMAKMRKRISALNKLTGAVEVKMCAGTWDTIDPTKIPQIAKQRYHLALLNQTQDGSARTTSAERQYCRMRYMEAMHRSVSAPKMRIAEDYPMVRGTVRQWLSNSLNSSH